ncbi:hypothetical protein KI387_036041, partial [Taxus chinensis]
YSILDIRKGNNYDEGGFPSRCGRRCCSCICCLFHHPVSCSSEDKGRRICWTSSRGSVRGTYWSCIMLLGSFESAWKLSSNIARLQRKQGSLSPRESRLYDLQPSG